MLHEFQSTHRVSQNLFQYRNVLGLLSHVLSYTNVNVSAKGSDGNAALHIAVRDKHECVIELLRDGGVDCSMLNDNQDTAAATIVDVCEMTTNKAEAKRLINLLSMPWNSKKEKRTQVTTPLQKARRKFSSSLSDLSSAVQTTMGSKRSSPQLKRCVSTTSFRATTDSADSLEDVYGSSRSLQGMEHSIAEAPGASYYRQTPITMQS
eukprot:comp22655_c0_seq1/m.34935 comp22655_c0_seq1/g.34935  ORF comp22655_c0_seq1/g.34935 comp22655_c0_seq1/m.34935 type:complete len:207 (-) comp22655_c0_seq1:1140-1760(-)